MGKEHSKLIPYRPPRNYVIDFVDEKLGKYINSKMTQNMFSVIINYFDFADLLCLYCTIKSLREKIMRVFPYFPNNFLMPPECPYIHYVIVKFTVLGIYDIRTQTRRLIKAPNLISHDVSSVMLPSLQTVFITAKASTFLFDIETFKFIKKILRFKPKSRNALASLRDQHVYCMGGCNRTLFNPATNALSLFNIVDECEKFDMANNKWTILPKLNEKRASTQGCVLNHRFVYIFGGIQPKGILSDSIEEMDSKRDDKWVLIRLRQKLIYSDVMCVQVAPNQILFFGSLSKKYLPNCSDKSFIFKFPQKYTYQIKENLQEPDSFISNCQTRWKNKIYTISTKFHIHIYDMVKAKWEMILQKDWIAKKNEELNIV